MTLIIIQQYQIVTIPMESVTIPLVATTAVVMHPKLVMVSCVNNPIIATERIVVQMLIAYLSVWFSLGSFAWA